jgi:lysophospholipase L1-like esterase
MNLGAWLLAALAIAGHSALQPPAQPPSKAPDKGTKTPAADRWEKEIAAIENKTAAKNPAPGCTIFVGSSSIKLWDIEKSFPGAGYLNHGFGGSKLTDSVRYFDRLVTRWRPGTIVVYAGENDIAAKAKAGDVHKAWTEFLVKAKEKAPRARLIFLSIKPSQKRWELYPVMKEANAAIEATCKSKGAEYLDVGSLLVDAKGEPRPELFRADKLHLSAAGYALWNEKVKAALAAKPASN